MRHIKNYVLGFFFGVAFFFLFSAIQPEPVNLVKKVEQLTYHNNNLSEILIEQNALIDSLKVELIIKDPETLWLARGIYSETDNPEEMLYVGQVIQNRKYLKRKSFKEVVLEPFQFSAFNEEPKRGYYVSRNQSHFDRNPVWEQAFRVAVQVRQMPPLEFPATHFYSPVSMVPKYRRPKWADSLTHVPVNNIDEERFLFYTYAN
jgi:hypothetical protein